MRVAVVSAEWGERSEHGPGWVLRFCGGAFDRVPLVPAPEWVHAGRNIGDDQIRDMVEATASWEGILLAPDFTLNVRR